MRRQSTLEKMDIYLDGKSASEVQMYSLAAFAICAAIIYLLVFPIAQEYFDTQESSNNKITTDLNNANNYLISVSEPRTLTGNRQYAIQQRQRELAGEKDKLQSTIDYNNHFANRLTELSTLTYNVENWANFLDSLAELAGSNSIKIQHITSTTKDIKVNDVVPVLDIGVSFTGQFNNVLRYINSIEESKLIVDINQMDINSTNYGLHGKLNIAIWGMKFQ